MPSVVISYRRKPVDKVSINNSLRMYSRESIRVVWDVTNSVCFRDGRTLNVRAPLYSVMCSFY